MLDTQIIPHNSPIVNQSSPYSPADQWADHKRTAARIAQRMIDAGYPERGYRIMACGDVISYHYCTDCDTWQIDRANLCRDRFCPICQWRLSLQRFAGMMDILAVIRADYPRAKWALITLTVPNCYPDNLRATMDKIAQAWHRVQQRKCAQALAGWARSWELTYNAVTKQVHPHMHLLAMWEGTEPTTESQIIDAWLSSCRQSGLDPHIMAQDAQQISGQSCNDGLISAVLETYKYAIKSSTIDAMPTGVLRLVARQWAGRRLVAFGGAIKEAAALSNISDWDAPKSDEIKLCRACASDRLTTYIYRWSFGDQAYHNLALHRAEDRATQGCDLSATR